jgi:hypothetical protein
MLKKKINKTVYIAPKVYAAITEKNKEYVKGFKDKNVSFDEIENFF